MAVACMERVWWKQVWVSWYEYRFYNLPGRSKKFLLRDVQGSIPECFDVPRPCFDGGVSVSRNPVFGDPTQKSGAVLAISITRRYTSTQHWSCVRRG